MNDTQPSNHGGTDPGSAAPPRGDTSTPAGEQPHEHSKGFFDQVRRLGIRRTNDRWIGGVCAGIAQRYHVDPLIIRAAAIALLLFGIGFLAYLIAWALLPDESGSILAEKGIREGDGWGIFLLIVIAIAVFGTGPWFSDGPGWGGPIIGLGVAALAWYLFSHRSSGSRSDADSATSTHGATGAGPSNAGSSNAGPSHAGHFGPHHTQHAWASGTSSVGYEPPPASEQARSEQASTAYRTPKAKRAGLAGLLLVIGAAVLAFGIGVAVGGSTFAGLLAATGAAGLVTMLLGAVGRRSVLSSLLSLGLAATLLGSWGAVQMPQGGFGEQLWRPVAASEQSTYSWAMGSATLDLRGITEAPEQEEIDASVSFGQLVIYVPEDVTTRVVAGAQFGSISIDGVESASGRETRGGTSIQDDRTFGTGDAELTVHANARFGQVQIVTTSDAR